MNEAEQYFVWLFLELPELKNNTLSSATNVAVAIRGSYTVTIFNVGENQ